MHKHMTPQVMKSQLVTDGDLFSSDGPRVSLARIQKYDMPKAKQATTVIHNNGTMLPDVTHPS